MRARPTSSGAAVVTGVTGGTSHVLGAIALGCSVQQARHAASGGVFAPQRPGGSRSLAQVTHGPGCVSRRKVALVGVDVKTVAW